MFYTQGIGLVIRGLCQFGQPHRHHQFYIQPVVQCRHHQIAVCGGIDLIRREVGGRGAEFAARHFAGCEVTDRAKRQPRDLRFEQRSLDALAAAGVRSGDQRQQDGLVRVHRRTHIANRYARPGRRSTGRSGHVHDAHEGLHDRVVGRLLAARPAVAKAGDRTVDDARIHFAYRFIVDAEPFRHAAPVILDKDVGGLAEIEQHVARLGVLQIQHYRALVAVHRQEFGALVAPERRAPGARLIARGRFDLDHIGAGIPQHHRAERARQHRRKIDYLDAFECSGHHLSFFASRLAT